MIYNQPIKFCKRRKLKLVTHQAIRMKLHGYCSSRIILTLKDALVKLANLLDAGKSPSSEDVDFLENILEQAPSLVQVIILLTKAYIKWEEGDTALEVLLDAQKRLPNDAQILDTLAAVLWGGRAARAVISLPYEGIRGASK